MLPRERKRGCLQVRLSVQSDFVRVTFDVVKSANNARERGLPFSMVEEFDFESATVAIDTRRIYGETRYVALGMLRGRLHVVCFTEVADGIRVISLRKANAREVKRYVQAQTTD